MENRKFDSAIFITVLIMYFGACGALWHLGYWSTFNINIFPFLDVVDIIKDSAYPLLVSTGIFLIAYLITTWIGKTKSDGASDEDISKREPLRLTLFIIKCKRSLLAFYTVLCYVLYLWDWENKPFVLPFLIAFPFVIAFRNHDSLKKVIPNQYFRYELLIVIVVFPIMSWCIAKRDSQNILNNKSYKVITQIQTSNDKTLTPISGVLGYKFLGSTSERMFLIDVNNREVTYLNMSEVLSYSYRDTICAK